MKLRAISQALAKRIDEWLMLPAADGGGGWPMDLLMELAGIYIHINNRNLSHQIRFEYC
jgi:hypothetical protein